MASIACLWSFLATIRVFIMALADTSSCCGYAMDNYRVLQYTYHIRYNVLLLERLA